MDYKETIAKALKGKSVNAAAKEWNIQQVTLNRYVKATMMPPYKVAMKIADEAGISYGEMLEILAREEERQHAEKNSKKHAALFSQAVAASMAAITAVTLFLTPSPSEAAPALKDSTKSICVMSNWRRRSAAIWTWFKRLFLRTALKPTTR